VRRTLALLPLLAALLLTGCEEEVAAAPRPVPTLLAPGTLVGGSLVLHLNDSPGTKAAFHADDKASLIDQGQLWEIRRKDRLVGTLQIATVKPDVDLTERDVRDDITAPVLVGARSDIRVLGQEVNQVQNEGGLDTLIWFGKGLFLVLQVKDQLVTGPQLVQEVIQHQQSRTEWDPLPELYSPS
jgi:hypothetical protein